MLIVQKHLSARRGRRAMQEGREAVERELWTILFDPECKDGLATVLGNVRRNAEAVRERLSFDTFRILRDLTEVIHGWELSPGHETDDALRLLEPADPISRGFQRHGHGEHDARLRLALPRHGAPARAVARDDPADPAARRARRAARTTARSSCCSSSRTAR